MIVGKMRHLRVFGWLLAASVLSCRGACNAPLQPEGEPPQLIRRVTSPSATPVRVDIDDASPVFLVAGMDGPIQVFAEALSDANRDASLPPAGEVLEARFSAAGVFVAHAQGPLLLWNFRVDQGLQTHPFVHRGRRAAISADGRFAAFGGAVSELATDRELGEPRPLASQSALAFSANSARVVSAGFQEPWIIVRDLPSGALRQWQAPDKVWNAALSPSADIVAASVKGGRIHFWRQPSGEELGSWRGQREGRGICFNPTGTAIVAADPEGVSLVDIARTRETWRANVEGELWVFACDGDLVAAGTRQGELWLWDVARQVLRARFRLSSSVVAALDINSKRHRIAAADEKGEAAIWSFR